MRACPTEIQPADRRAVAGVTEHGASGEQLVEGRARIYYRAGFFDAAADSKAQGEPAYEMSSVTLDNGIELYGTHEESDAAKIGRAHV